MNIKCTKHPRYTAKQKPKSCPSCWLLYILRWQLTREAGKKLGELNPYQFLPELIEECCYGLKVSE